MGIQLLLLLTMITSGAQGQQAYVNNQQLACENPATDNNITRGYLCNGLRRSCQSYISFRTDNAHNSPHTIAALFGGNAQLVRQITSLNNLSDEVTPIPPNTLVLLPVNCSCAGTYYQHNVSYTITRGDETYFTISNDTFQGLTTCQAMKAQNPLDYRNLYVNATLLVPLRCACPTSAQSLKYEFLLTYMVTWGDSVSAIAQSFRADEPSVAVANNFSTRDANILIFPFTPILVPLTSEPIFNPQTQSPSAPAPPPQTPILPVAQPKSSNKLLLLGVGIAAGSLLLFFSLLGILLAFYRRLRAHKAVSGAPSRRPPEMVLDSGTQSWSLPASFQGVRGAIEALTEYKLADLRAATSDFSEANRIKGSVYRGSFGGDNAAVKVIKGNDSAEINLLKKMNHTNIIRLSGFCVHQDTTYLVYEYAEKGCLSDWIHPTNKSQTWTLSWKQRVQIAYDVADALNYLHNFASPAYVHNNLKTTNILLDSHLRGKVANFGFARSLDKSNAQGGLQLTRHVVGTQGYLAPEYIDNGLITPKLDIFAFGVILLQLLSGRQAAAADKNSAEELLSASIEKVLQGSNVRDKFRGFMDPCLTREYPLDLAFSMAQLAQKCVAHDPNTRPSMDQVLVTLSKILSSSLDWEPFDELDRSLSQGSDR